jgi:NO-binding membrane sensor protein with MHYT domain/two-component sensor histidine kinase
MHPHYVQPLVWLSIAVAVAASFTALDLADRMKAAVGTAKRLWWAGAAVTMGGGIWSMHFVGMLAFDPGVPVAYDAGTTAASLALPIAVTGMGLAVVAPSRPSRRRVLVAGVLMGLGIVSMHYLGMAGMIMPARIEYDAGWVALSVAIAVGASLAALLLVQGRPGIGTRTGAAVLMGAAVSGMHYTGMTAATFHLLPDAEMGEAGLKPAIFAALVALTTFGILLVALACSWIEQRLDALRFREEARRALLEERLAAERWVSEIAANLPGAIFRRVLHADGSMSYAYASDRMAELLSVEPQDVGRRMPVADWAARLFPRDAEAWCAQVRESARTLAPMRFEARVPGIDGERCVRSLANPRREADGSVTWDGVLLDVTEVVRKEQQLAASLADKEILLREIHHRVKNNLQVVTSLLRLELRNIDDPRARERIDTVVGRVGVMARLHEQLYRSVDLGRVDVAAHLRDLCADLASGMGERGVRVEVAAVPLWCDLDTAIPLGLIVNELVTNGLKHAYPQGGGTIRVALGKDGERVEVSVSDDGVGSGGSGGVQDPGRGIGRGLVAALARQLNAELVTEGGPGMRTALVLSARAFREPSREAAAEAAGD